MKLETDFAVAEIDNEAKELVSFDDRRIPFDLLVTVPVNMGPDYIEASGLGNELNLVPCDQNTMRSLEHDNIFVLGDGGTLQTSKAGSVAHFSVDVFMENFDDYRAGRPLKHSFDGHANCFIESGSGKGMLLDFNYDTQPYTGWFPLPFVGPLRLLKETRLNHWAKLAFRWVYWNMLIVGRPLPFTINMSRLGKVIEDEEKSGVLSRIGGVVGSVTRRAAAPKQKARAESAAVSAPATSAPAPKRPVSPRPKARPTAKPQAARPASKPSGKASKSQPSEAVPAYVERPGVNSTADPATVLPDPIIPTF